MLESKSRLKFFKFREKKPGLRKTEIKTQTQQICSSKLLTTVLIFNFKNIKAYY